MKAGATLPPADADDLDGLGDALQAHLARFGDGKFARLDGVPAGEHLPTLRLGRDARRLMDALAAVVNADPSGGGLMQPNPNLRRKAVIATMVGQRPLDQHSTLDGTVGLFKANEEAVAGMADLLAGMPSK